ncbi:MAG: hypothetical protein IJ365_05440, partial [Clostridia bacterium]|nr:hypothetical protein [Clostridia bacterium]
MKIIDTLYGAKSSCATLEEMNIRQRRIFYDVVLLVAWLLCLPAGALPQFNTILSVGLVACVVISFFDDNLYIYAALFMYMRYRMELGSEPAYRIYSYLVALRFLTQLPKMKFRILYLPAIFVFLLHSIFATANVESVRVALNI